jgi:peptide/nickel transport system permease protein
MATALSASLTRARDARAERRRGAAVFLARRLGFYLLAVWFALTLNFVIPRLMPGDPAEAVVKQIQNSTGMILSPEALGNIRTLFGNPDEGMFQQYLNYLGQISHFDLGLSTSRFPVPVSSLLQDALPWSIGLAGSSVVLSFVVGMVLGTISGWRQGSRFDSVMGPLSTFLLSVPYFWIALVAVWFFSFRLRWFPSAGGYDPNVVPGVSFEFTGSVLYYAALPVATIVFSSFSGWLLGMRNMVVTTRSEDYVTLARAKGLPSWRIMLAYAGRNAAIPSLTQFAATLGSIVGGALLTEIVFSYPGVGYLLYDAVSKRDYPLMQAVFLVITICVLTANLIADSLYALIDPRARQGEHS